MYADSGVQLQTIDRRKFDQYNYISEDEDDDYEVSSDEQAVD
jgi:palmitoyltransferase